MLVRYAEGQQRSGSMGATTFSRNRFGQYMRTRSKPVNPNTDAQAEVRNNFRTLMAAWNATLTLAQREAWSLYAANINWLNKLGDTVKLTGPMMFLRSNAARLAAGLDIVANGPTVLTLPANDEGFLAVGDESDQEIDIAFSGTGGWTTSVGAGLAVYQGQPISTGREYFNGPYRFLGLIAGAAMAPTSPQTFTDLPFAIAQGQNINVRARVLLADGRVSAFFKTSFQPVA